MVSPTGRTERCPREEIIGLWEVRELAGHAERAVRERSAKLNALLQVGYFIVGVRAASWPQDR